MNDIDGVAGTPAVEDAVVIDFSVPIDCLGSAEFAAAARFGDSFKNPTRGGYSFIQLVFYNKEE